MITWQIVYRQSDISGIDLRNVITLDYIPVFVQYFTMDVAVGLTVVYDDYLVIYFVSEW